MEEFEKHEENMKACIERASNIKTSGNVMFYKYEEE